MLPSILSQSARAVRLPRLRGSASSVGQQGSWVVRPAAARTMASAPAAIARPSLLLSPKELHAIVRESQQQQQEPQQSSASQRRPLRILDATWFMPNVPRDASAEYRAGPRLPGALFWDVDRVATTKDDQAPDGKSLNPLGLAHMMPPPERFSQVAGEHFGISHDTHVVVYDTHGVFSAPRTAFTFHAFGHPAVSILDGGLPAWVAAGLPVEEAGSEPEGPNTIRPKQYPVPTLSSGLIRTFDEMMANVRMGARGQTVLDARPPGRFEGTAPEPRPGLSSGHIPGSLSLPVGSLTQTHTDPNDASKAYTTLKGQTDLWRTISDAVGGMEALDKLRQASSAGEPAATNTCGSGMTAAILWLSLHQLGIQSAIYDESWTGYAQRKESVIDKADTDSIEK